MRITLNLIAALSIGAFSASSATQVVRHPVVLDTNAAVQASRTPLSEATKDALSQSARWLSASELAIEIDRILSELSPPEAEYVVQSWLQQSRQQMAPNAALAIDRLTQYQSQVLVPHHDSPRNSQVLYPIAATAAGIQNQWRFDALRFATAAALSRQDAHFWQQLPTQPTSNELAAIKAGIEASALPTTQTKSLQNWIDERPNYRPLALTLALRSGDPHGLISALQRNPAQRVQTLLELGQQWPRAQALEVWQVWLDADDASAAAAALRQLGRHQGDEIWFDYLGHHSLGVVAAQELSRQQNRPAVADRLSQLIAEGGLAGQRAQLVQRLAELEAGP